LIGNSRGLCAKPTTGPKFSKSRPRAKRRGKRRKKENEEKGGRRGEKGEGSKEEVFEKDFFLEGVM
jgi:hypothetical protein